MKKAKSTKKIRFFLRFDKNKILYERSFIFCRKKIDFYRLAHVYLKIDIITAKIAPCLM